MEPDVMKRVVVSLFAIFLLGFVFSFGRTGGSADREGLSFQQSLEDQDESEVETIVPGPKDVRQATAIYVFLGWIWLSIGILIFFLLLKIKEVDRLHLLGYFSEDND